MLFPMLQPLQPQPLNLNSQFSNFTSHFSIFNFQFSIFTPMHNLFILLLLSIFPNMAMAQQSVADRIITLSPNQGKTVAEALR